MTKQESTLKAIPQPPQVQGPMTGVSPTVRKAHAEKALRDLEAQPTEAEIRERQRQALEAEIAEAEEEQAQELGAGLEPSIRAGAAEYILAQKVIAPRFSSAVLRMREAVEAAVEAEKVIRRLRDTLARQIEGDLALRLERESAGRSPDQVLELQRNLLLEGHGEFRRRWSELARETGAQPLLGGIDPDSDLARDLVQALQREVGRQLGPRPEPFTRQGTWRF